MDSIGSVHSWGFSPSFSLINDNNIANNVRILLGNECDLRHVLHTLNNLDNNVEEIEFIICETTVEPLTRQMLFWSLLCEDLIPVQNRIELLLPLFGNLTIGEGIYDVFISECEHLIDELTEFENRSHCSDRKFAPDFSLLKYKHRDEMINALDKWKKKNLLPSNLWDDRIRAHLKDRYGAKYNLFDWDVTMEFSKFLMGPIVNKQMYKEFRDKGTAFVGIDQNAVNIFQNPTLFRDNQYQGDIVVGPYIGYGALTDMENAYKTKYDGTGQHTIDQIIFYNLQKVLQKLDSLDIDVHVKPFLGLPENLPSKFKESIDYCFLSVFLSGQLNKDQFRRLIKNTTIIYVETPKAMFTFGQFSEFCEKATKLANDMNLHRIDINNKQFFCQDNTEGSWVLSFSS
eukprot:TRINITY_DN983_c0_g1_i1.p1 TRINITY_DN983_c0_g1~~TRINITY_DN983_c0_g1_i1.p1  ORF type:complete len:411 (+),score=80.68 TRINITY_DN983_c0_g1_i1:35-1234(+)